MSRDQIHSLLVEIRETREQVLAELDDLTEDEFALSTDFRPWKWDTALRVVLQFGNHMREHSTQIRGARSAIDRAPTQAQRMLAEAEVSWGILLAATVGLTDEDLDVAPPNGGWSIKQVLEHILNGERGYLDAMRRARSEQ